ncbi:MAG: hypothetical protein AAFY17_16825 [Cyanobacteria bacterium J06642_11]
MSDSWQQVTALSLNSADASMLHPEADQLAKVAGDILADPILFRQLCDRVYELLQKDLRSQRERSYGYGRNL